MIYGARASLLVAFASVHAVRARSATLLGMIAGYRRGWAEIVIMRVVDMFLSIPAILLAIITVAVLGPGLVNVILVLGSDALAALRPRRLRPDAVDLPTCLMSGCRRSWAPARCACSAAMSCPTSSAPLTRGGDARVRPDGAVRGGAVLPRPRRAAADARAGARCCATGRNYVANAWWIATFPGLCLFLLVLSVNLIGDELRDRLDPRATMR